MAKTKLNITDARMLELIELLKQNGTIKYRQEFCERYRNGETKYYKHKKWSTAF